jgi:hypothetical protein
MMELRRFGVQSHTQRPRDLEDRRKTGIAVDGQRFIKTLATQTRIPRDLRHPLRPCDIAQSARDARGRRLCGMALTKTDVKSAVAAWEVQLFALELMAFALKGMAFAPKGMGFAPEGMGFAPNAIPFAPEGMGFAPKGVAFATNAMAFAPKGMPFKAKGWTLGVILCGYASTLHGVGAVLRTLRSTALPRLLNAEQPVGNCVSNIPS